MQKLNKVNLSDEVIVNFTPSTGTELCNVCLVPGNSTSGQYSDVKEVEEECF